MYSLVPVLKSLNALTDFSTQSADFVPETFSLPREGTQALDRIGSEGLVQGLNDREVPGKNNQNLWIVKPANRSGQLPF